MTAGEVVVRLLLALGALMFLSTAPFVLMLLGVSVWLRLRDAHARVVARGRDAMEVRR